MHDLDGSVVYREFERQYKANPDRFNLTDLWRAAGRKPSRSPRRILRRDLRGQWPVISDPGGSADAPVIADFDTALAYVERLDVRILFATNEVFGVAIGKDPAGAVMRSGTPFVGIFATIAERKYRGCTYDEAADLIVRRIAERTAHQGEYAQESAVARAQRAVRGEQELNFPRSEG